MIAELPQSREDYEVRFKAHYRSRGSGEDTTISFPCPFCAAASWFEAPVVEFNYSTSPIYCTECGRSARFEYSEDEYGIQRLELIHVAGDTPPEWLPDVRSDVPEPQGPDERSIGFLPPTVDDPRPSLPDHTVTLRTRMKGGKKL